MSKRWFVLKVGTNRENRIRKTLWNRIQTNDLVEKIPQLLVVTERVTEIKNGQRRNVERCAREGSVGAPAEPKRLLAGPTVGEHREVASGLSGG